MILNKIIEEERCGTNSVQRVYIDMLLYDYANVLRASGLSGWDWRQADPEQ